MKSNKVLKLITKILIIVLVSLVSFIGVYVKVQNRMENKVKDYQLGMDLKGSRVFSIKVNKGKETIIKDKDGNIVEEATDEEISKNGYTKEEKVINAEEVLNLENYKKTKEIIEKRLNKLNVQDYNIRLNEENGTIYLEIPENQDTDHTVSNISEAGKFQIIDKDTKEVLMDNSMIKSANILQNADTNGTIIYLNIKFNKEGTEKLKEISKTYVKIEDPKVKEDNNNAAEETTSEEETKTQEKQITMQIDGSEMVTTSFEEEIVNGTIQLSMGAATTDKDTLKNTIQSASTIAILLNLGNLPIDYQVDENKYVEAGITKDVVVKCLVVIASLIIIGLIILIIKYRFLGLLSSISFIGLTAIYLLLLRYTNTIISMQGIAGIILTLVINYVFNIMILNNIKKNKDEKVSVVITNTYKEFVMRIIPVAIISIVFCFIGQIAVNSFGMTLFWGIVTILVYNIVTKRLLEIKLEK